MDLLTTIAVAGVAQAIFMGLKALQYANVVQERYGAVVRTQVLVDACFFLVLGSVLSTAMAKIGEGSTLEVYLQLAAMGGTIGLLGGVGMALTRYLQVRAHDRKTDITDSEAEGS